MTNAVSAYWPHSYYQGGITLVGIVIVSHSQKLAEGVKELAETGYDKFGDGEHLFPYDLIMPDGVALEDDKTYTVVICGASKAVQEEGSVQDTGIVGLTVMQDYLSRFDTFSPADITWN